jgi:predicted DCC family thiol-disulfide oxidoreductase YuxK
MGKTIVLYDGVCGLCYGFVRFMLRFDKRDRFRYAALQSDFAAEVLKRHGLNSNDLSSVVLVTDFGLPREKAHTQFDGVLEGSRGLGGIWKLGLAAKVLPREVRNWIYDAIARNRYKWFGRNETCSIPTLEHRVKFVDHTIEKLNSGRKLTRFAGG